MKIYRILPTFILITLGCVSQRVPYSTENGSATILLAEAADTVSRSMVELTKIQVAATPPSKEKQLPDPEIPELQGIATVDWSGPIEPLVKHLAQACRYKLSVLGREPAVPIIITLNKKNTTIASLLRDIDYMVDKKAQVKIYPQKQTIELRYART